VCSVDEILDDHIGLDLECLDRIYLNGYMPNLSRWPGGDVFRSASSPAHRLASPVREDGERLPRCCRRLRGAAWHPVLQFGKDDRKIEIIQPYFDRAREPGVVAIGIAQEFQSVFAAYDRSLKRGKPRPTAHYAFVKADRRVTVY